MKERLGIIKVILVILGFALSLSLTFVSSYAEETEEFYTIFESTDIPTLYMKTEQGKIINPATGYTTDVGARLMFSGVTPLNENREVDIAFYENNSKIKNISFQVRDIESDQLLEDTVVKNIVQTDDYVTARLAIKNLIMKDKEYLLTITISTDTKDNLKYYQRIIWSDNLKTDEKLDFVLKFNSYSYNKEQLSKVSQWIETSEKGDNTNLGRVNIYSTRAQVGWADLVPRIEGNVIPVIWDITPTNAQISLKYHAVTVDTNADATSYVVKDYYKIVQTRSDIYLMDYERETDQIFDAYNDLQSRGRINLGIKSDLKDIESKADATGKFSYFVQNGNLWTYARTENKFTKVFSFAASEESAGKELDENHQIKIVNVDTEGNAWFSVCGYMNGGTHDGMSGISLFEYNYSENIVKEHIFIPVSKPFDILMDNVGDISYINGDTYYVKINQYVYAIDLISGEYMLVIDQLYDGTYSVNKSGDKIAYHDTHTINTNKRIKIFDFETETETTIKGSSYGSGNDNDYLKIIGYIGDDLLYGMANPEDVRLDVLNPIFAMHTLLILDDGHFLMKKYNQENSYVYDAQIEGLRANLWRVEKNEEGNYESISIDQLLSREENLNSNIYTEIVTTSLRQKELYLNIPTTSADLETVGVRYAKEIRFIDKETQFIDNDYKFGKTYIVYGYGEKQGHYDNIKEAINVASAVDGIVLDFDGNYVWKATMGDEVIVWDTPNMNMDVTKFKYNLSGVNLNNIFYYISIGKVVAARDAEDNYVYIYAFDSSNIQYYDARLDKTVTLDREKATKKFIQWDNEFLLLE